MDISKRDSGCNPLPRLGMEIAGNFSEKFSDSPLNHGDLARFRSNYNGAKSPCEEQAVPNFSKTEICSKEGEIGRTEDTNVSSSALSTLTSKKTLPKQSPALSKTKNNLCPSSSSLIRDGRDIKKEDASLSPQNISPMGLTSGIGQQSLRDNEDSNGFNRTVNRSPSFSDKSETFSRIGCHEIEERSTIITLANPGKVTTNIEAVCSVITGTSVSPKCKTESEFVSNISKISRNLASFNGSLAKYSSASEGDIGLPLNSSGGNSGSEYLQQQNHVFVFSTQLANKSAEAVLCGQFPTIIAYHCMQPTTKLFLEDFLKNPTKTSKLQKQYSLNIMNTTQSGLSGPGGSQPPQWLNECISTDQLPSQRIPLRNVGERVVDKSNPIWDPTSLHDNQMTTAPSTLETLNNAESGIQCKDKSNIPSLQGVKVPNENLTPQQRLHREEQLAKLKKMNKFLFPENEGNDFHGAPLHGTSSLTSDAAGISGDMIHNPADCETNKICPPAMRNTSGNLEKSATQNLDTISGIGVSESVMLPDLRRSSNGTPNAGQVQNHKFSGYMSKMKNSSTISNFNELKSRQCESAVGTGGSPDNTSAGNFIMTKCPSSQAESVGSAPSGIAMSQSEWNKYQSSSFQDGFKGEMHDNIVKQTAVPLGCQQNSTLSRSLSTGITSYGSVQPRPDAGPSSTNRNNNGPPPPYHPTTRSASVPIAAQSPTHSSPNKLSSDMPLPSTQASSRVQFGASSTPPNTEISNPTISTCTTYVGSTNANSTAQVNSHNISILNNMPTNSPASLSHTTPRELDCIEPGGQKSKMESPHKFKIACGMTNDLPDMDSKYSNFGMGYSTCNMSPQIMRHNMQQMPPQFCRRIDNIPLNPNCSRMSQSKNVNNFDPISSLTQMSQQLTGVGLSAIGGGGNASVGLGVMDINHGDSIAGGSSMRGSGDSSLDHCNQISNANNMGMVGGMAGALGRVTGQFAPEISNMLCGDTGLMDQRMLNGKMCVPNMHGSFGSNSALTGVGLRESAMGCNDMSSLNRTLNRRGMPGNFDNFGMSPNIHVKASAPNTIQYMPARSQNMNNIRVPPSIEFIQRYSNSQVIGSVGGGIGHSSGGPMTNDIANSNGMNMFGNSTQMLTTVGQLSGNGNRGFEQNDLVEGNVLSNNKYMNVPE